MNVKVKPASARLQCLGPADFAAIRRHRGVVGHVLRLERRDLYSAIVKQTAKTGDQHGFSDIRARALKH